MLQYAATVQNAVTRLILTGLCTDTTISFYTSLYNFAADNYFLDAAPDDNSCHVFHPNGGGVSWRALPHIAAAAGATAYHFSGLVAVQGVGRSTNGTPEGNELVMIARISRDACMSINRRAGIATVDGDPPFLTPPVAGHFAFGVDGGYSFNQWMVDNQGSPYGLGAWDTIGWPHGWENMRHMAGHTTGCWWQTVQDAYHFYHVILAR